MHSLILRRNFSLLFVLTMSLTSILACGPIDTDDSVFGTDGGVFQHESPAEQHDAGSSVGSDSGLSSGQNNGGYDSGTYYYDSGIYDSGPYSYGDASCAPDSTYNSADAATPEPNDAGPVEDVDAGEQWAWFQLSTDDSTSMATAQLLKLRNRPWGFNLHSHEVMNYYDPPESLRSDDGPAMQWSTEEGFVIAVEARPAAVETQEQQAFDAGPGSGTDYEMMDACGFPDSGDVDHQAPNPESPAPDRSGMEMLVHVFAPAIQPAERRPWNLHLCVDVSGSMDGDKINYTRDALRRLLNQMQAGDQLSLTSFESSAHQLFASLDVDANRDFILDKINNLQAGGGTNMIAGLRQAYGNAQSAYDPQMINRVIVFSDGDANVGDTDIAEFSRLTRINNQEGIYLSGVGVGLDYAWERMDALCDAGKGAHVFLPNADEVGVVFGRMLPKLIEVAADQVAIELQLPPGFALEHFSGEEVSTNQQHRVANVVLAAGDDMTLLAKYSSTDPDELQQDMIMTLRYRPLGSAEQQVWTQRIAIQDLMSDAGSALMQRTALVERYANWALGQSDEDGALLEMDLRDFYPSDDGLIEMANLVRDMTSR